MEQAYRIPLLQQNRKDPFSQVSTCAVSDMSVLLNRTEKKLAHLSLRPSKRQSTVLIIAPLIISPSLKRFFFLLKSAIAYYAYIFYST